MITPEPGDKGKNPPFYKFFKKKFHTIVHLNRESSSSFNYFHHRNAHFLLHLRPLKTHLPIKPTKLKSQLKTTKIGAFLQRFSILILNYNETIISYLFLYVRTYWRRPMCIFLFGDENPPQTLINPPIQPISNLSNSEQLTSKIY